MTTLVTGATGYVGGKLVPELLRRGHDVRVLTRSAGSLSARDWADRVEVVEGDATSATDLDRALAGVRTAYYLLHSMDGQGDFAERDRQLAEGFADAAARAAGLWPRLVVTVPVLTPSLASHWVGLVTPVSAGVAKPLVGSLAHDAVCDESDLLELVGPPPGGPTGYGEALRRPLAEYDPLDWSRTLRRTAGAVALTALVGGLATDPGSRWYRRLRKPAWQPPATAFPVVWTALYAGIAVAGTAAQTELPEGRRRFAGALGANLVLNAAWSVVFFRLHRPTAATGVAAALAASSADLARRAAPTGRGKVAALGAYAAWCGFASVLSGRIAWANPEGGGGPASTRRRLRRRMGA